MKDLLKSYFLRFQFDTLAAMKIEKRDSDLNWKSNLEVQFERLYYSVSADTVAGNYHCTKQMLNLPRSLEAIHMTPVVPILIHFGWLLQGNCSFKFLDQPPNLQAAVHGPSRPTLYQLTIGCLSHKMLWL